jgi:hypothetical protein
MTISLENKSTIVIIVIITFCQLPEKRNQNKDQKSDKEDCPQEAEYKRSELFTSEFASETDFDSSIRDNSYDDSSGRSQRR